MKVLQLTRLHEPTEQALAASHEVTIAPQTRKDLHDLLLAEQNFEGIVTNGKGKVDRALLEKLPQLRVISCFGAGMDNLDLQLIGRRGISVYNTSDALKDDVADHAMGLVIGLLRQIVRFDRDLRNRAWHEARQRLSVSLFGKRMGIVGLGKIGCAIANRGSAFRMEIAYSGPSRKIEQPFIFFSSVKQLARWCDVLIVCCPGGPATQHLIDVETLEALGPSGWLVNVARGSVVDQTALLSVLRNSGIAGVALDVFEDEPDVPLALIEDPRTVLTPHVSSGTHQTRERMGQMMIAALDKADSTVQC